MCQVSTNLLTQEQRCSAMGMSSHVMRESSLCTSYIQPTRTSCQPCSLVGYSYTAAISACRLEDVYELCTKPSHKKDHTHAKRSDILEATRNAMAKACFHCPRVRSTRYHTTRLLALGSRRRTIEPHSSSPALLYLYDISIPQQQQQQPHNWFCRRSQ